jgi:hypothetical protein
MLLVELDGAADDDEDEEDEDEVSPADATVRNESTSLIGDSSSMPKKARREKDDSS